MKSALLFIFISLIGQLLFAAPLKIIIDPGHGGSDAGAVQGDVQEAEIALSVSLILNSLLEQDPHFMTFMTRKTNKALTLQERVNIADKLKGDLFLSIHANASKDQRAKGVEFYFQNHLAPDEETLFLASAENKVANEVSAAEDDPSQKSDVKAIIEDLNRTHRMSSSLALSKTLLNHWQGEKKDLHAVRQAPFFVVSKVGMPSVLVELGFVTNPKEAQKLLLKSYQKEIAQKIYLGLKDYKESMDKSPSQRLQ